MDQHVCNHLKFDASSLVHRSCSHIACWKDRTFTVSGDNIFCWIKGRPVRRLGWSKDTSGSSDSGKRKRAGSRSAGARDASGRVLSLLALGDFLISLHAGSVVRIWDAKGAVTLDSAAADAGRDSGPDFLVNTVRIGELHAPVDDTGASAAASSASAGSTAAAAAAAPTAAEAFGEATCLLHPDTYVNKIAVGTAGGAVLIVNVRTGRLVYACRVAPGVAVTTMAQSDVVDVVGVGLADGRIVVHNLRADARVCAFAHARADAGMAGGAVTSLSFSSEGVLGAPVLASTTASGALALWNLGSKALQALVTSAHDAAIAFAAWLPHQAAILTAGADNAVHIWQVDKLDGVPRVLRSRSGHTAPPRMLRYYGGTSVTSLGDGASATACEIASAGSDRALRSFHTALAQQNVELSQGSLLSKARELRVHPNSLRLPPITALAVSDRRHSQWADVVTAHAGCSQAYLWSWENKRVEPLVLPIPARTGGPAAAAAAASAAAAAGGAGSASSSGTAPPPINTEETVTSVAISACGNFSIIGSSAGGLFKFNLQSGAARGSYPKEDTSGPSLRGLATRGARKGGLHDNADAVIASDPDVGKGFGPSHRLKVVDSFDTSLMKVMGIVPAALKHLMPKARAFKPSALPGAGSAAFGGAGAGAGAGAAASSAAASAVPDSAAEAAAAAASGAGRHSCAVAGMAIDSLNKALVTVDTAGTVLFWDFASHALLGALELPGGASRLVMHGDSGLAAVACPEDFTVIVIDVALRRIVRRCVGHANAVTDLAFSPDGRWLVSGSLDRSARVWDLPTGRCVDWLSFDSPPVSLAFAPTGEYLATAHADSVGVALWANKAHFGRVVLEGAAAPRKPCHMGLPQSEAEPQAADDEDEVVAAGAGAGAGRAKSVAGVGAKRRAAAASGSSDSSDSDSGSDSDSDDSSSSGGSATAPAAKRRANCDSADAVAASASFAAAAVPAGPAPASKPGCAVTLSSVPISRWQDLTRLDVIAARNKPVEPPKKPAAAPFFLPTAAGLNPTFVAPGASASLAPLSANAVAAAGAAAGAGAGAASSSGDAAAASGEWTAAWPEDAEGEEEDDDGVAGAGAGAGAGSGSRVGGAGVHVRGRLIKARGVRMARSQLAALLRTFAEAQAGAAAAAAGGSSSTGSASAAVSDAATAVLEHMCRLAPSAADLELRSLCLGPEDEDGAGLLAAALSYIAFQLAAGTAFDVTEAHLQLLLQLYQETIAALPGLRRAAAAVKASHEARAGRLRLLMDQTLSLVGALLGQ